MTETQTGFQWRRREQSIGVGELRGTLAAEHAVGDRDRAELAVRIAGIALDRGEESLWAHALGRDDVWYLCGPDQGQSAMRRRARVAGPDRVVAGVA